MYSPCAASYIYGLFVIHWGAYHFCWGEVLICVCWAFAWFGYCLVFVGGFLMVLMSIYCSVECEIGGNFDMDVIVYCVGEDFALDIIVCVLCTVWTNIWSMILFWQWMYRKSWSYCCCCWYEYYDLFLFSFEIASMELYMFQFVHPFSETCFLFRLNCNRKWVDEALFLFVVNW